MHKSVEQQSDLSHFLSLSLSLSLSKSINKNFLKDSLNYFLIFQEIDFSSQVLVNNPLSYAHFLGGGPQSNRFKNYLYTKHLKCNLQSAYLRRTPDSYI